MPFHFGIPYVFPVDEERTGIASERSRVDSNDMETVGRRGRDSECRCGRRCIEGQRTDAAQDGGAAVDSRPPPGAGEPAAEADAGQPAAIRRDAACPARHQRHQGPHRRPRLADQAQARLFRRRRSPTPRSRGAILRQTLEEPNSGDSFRTLIEQVLEDALVGGYGAIEMELTGDPARPFELWPVDGATIKINAKWDGSPAMPRYAQATGLAMGQLTPLGGDSLETKVPGLIPLLDDELIYIRLNPRSYTPFGLGPLEVAFETVNSFLGAHRFAGKLASNSVVQYALWLNETSPSQHERLIRWWQDEIEGTGRVPLISSEQKPEVLRFAAGTDADLRLSWQEFLIRMVGNAFSLPPMLLGLERDVNQSTASEQADEAFRSAIVPLAKLIAEHLTRDLFGKKLGWTEFEFAFNELDARDEMTEVEMQTKLLAAGVLTVNEVRAMRGLGPLPERVAAPVAEGRGPPGRGGEGGSRRRPRPAVNLMYGQSRLDSRDAERKADET